MCALLSFKISQCSVDVRTEHLQEWQVLAKNPASGQPLITSLGQEDFYFGGQHNGFAHWDSKY